MEEVIVLTIRAQNPDDDVTVTVHGEPFDSPLDRSLHTQIMRCVSEGLTQLRKAKSKEAVHG